MLWRVRNRKSGHIRKTFRDDAPKCCVEQMDQMTYDDGLSEIRMLEIPDYRAPRLQGPELR